MLFLQLYLIGGLLFLLIALSICRSKHFEENEPWVIGLLIVIVCWPVFFMEALSNWVVDQVKWRWG